MGILSQIINSKSDKIEQEVVEEQKVDSAVEYAAETSAGVPIESPETKTKMFKVRFSGKRYKVPAESKERAIEKIKALLGVDGEVEITEKKHNITIGEIFNSISEEIKRIVTDAHPEVVTNSYDRWAAVLTEELGEIVHEINDAYEGKPAKKNTFVECIQLSAATILLAKKFANEHPEFFREVNNNE